MRKVHRPSGSNLSQADTQAELCLRTSSLNCCPLHVTVHRHKDDPSFEVARVRVVAPEHRLSFEETLSRYVSWVHPPLEHYWLSGDVVELKVFWGAKQNQQFFSSPAFLLIVDGGFHFPPRHNTESLKTCTSAGSCWANFLIDQGT